MLERETYQNLEIKNRTLRFLDSESWRPWYELLKMYIDLHDGAQTKELIFCYYLLNNYIILVRYNGKINHKTQVNECEKFCFLPQNGWIKKYVHYNDKRLKVKCIHIILLPPFFPDPGPVNPKKTGSNRIQIRFQETMNRVKTWCQYTWTTQKSFDERAILNYLPGKMMTGTDRYKVIQV